MVKPHPGGVRGEGTYFGGIGAKTWYAFLICRLFLIFKSPSLRPPPQTTPGLGGRGLAESYNKKNPGLSLVGISMGIFYNDDNL